MDAKFKQGQRVFYPERHQSRPETVTILEVMVKHKGTPMELIAYWVTWEGAPKHTGASVRQDKLQHIPARQQLTLFR